MRGFHPAGADDRRHRHGRGLERPEKAAGRASGGSPRRPGSGRRRPLCAGQGAFVPLRPPDGPADSVRFADGQRAELPSGRSARWLPLAGLCRLSHCLRPDSALCLSDFNRFSQQNAGQRDRRSDGRANSGADPGAARRAGSGRRQNPPLRLPLFCGY